MTAPPSNSDGNPWFGGTAIGVDIEKFVWLIDQDGWAWKIDGTTSRRRSE